MLYHLDGAIMSDGSLRWAISEGGHWEKEDGVKLSFLLSYKNHREAVKELVSAIAKENLSWITYTRNKWNLDLDKFKEFIALIFRADTLIQIPWEWFKGKVPIEPEYETEKGFDFYIVHEVLESLAKDLEIPTEIKESLELFKQDYPHQDKVAFIMMEFDKTTTHNEILNVIRKVLDSHSISGVRADDKQYHDDLFSNVLTYIFGCGFGIAVFERIEEDIQSPNVSLEVGYMLALKKNICLLKDRTLTTLPTDLIGKLYREFDPQNPSETITRKISEWLSDKRIV